MLDDAAVGAATTATERSFGLEGLQLRPQGAHLPDPAIEVADLAVQDLGDVAFWHRQAPRRDLQRRLRDM